MLFSLSVCLGIAWWHGGCITQFCVHTALLNAEKSNEWNQIVQSVSFPKANSTVEYKRGPYHSNLPTWRAPLSLPVGRGGIGWGRGETNTIEKLAELRDSVSCLWTAVSAEEWKCFPLFGVKRTRSVGLPIIVPKASKLDFQHHFSQKSTLFPLSPWLPALKKKERKSSCLWWTEVRFLRGNIWEELTSFSRQCHSVMEHVLPPRKVSEWNVHSLCYSLGDDRLTTASGSCQTHWRAAIGGCSKKKKNDTDSWHAIKLC